MTFIPCRFAAAIQQRDARPASVLEIRELEGLVIDKYENARLWSQERVEAGLFVGR
jgi:hypothetical protein